MRLGAGRLPKLNEMAREIGYAGQREDYLKMSLRGFHDGTRPGYTQAMTAAVSQIPLEDLDTLAYYVARFPAPVPGGK